MCKRQKSQIRNNFSVAALKITYFGEILGVSATSRDCHPFLVSPALLTHSPLQVQCNSCQSSVTFCSGCGGRLALFVPGSTTGSNAAEAVSTSPDDTAVVKSEAAVSSSGETTDETGKSEDKTRSGKFSCLEYKLEFNFLSI